MGDMIPEAWLKTLRYKKNKGYREGDTKSL